MSTLRKTTLTLAAASLLSAAWMANASDDTATTSAAPALDDARGGYAVDATDRGGKESQEDGMTFEIALFDWLRGLMD